jgi:hypothetical protein
MPLYKLLKKSDTLV